MSDERMDLPSVWPRVGADDDGVRPMQREPDTANHDDLRNHLHLRQASKPADDGRLPDSWCAMSATARETRGFWRRILMPDGWPETFISYLFVGCGTVLVTLVWLTLAELWRCK